MFSPSGRPRKGRTGFLLWERILPELEQDKRLRDKDFLKQGKSNGNAN